MLKRKSIIGSSRDTGYRIYEKYRDRKSECIQPVFKDINPAYLKSPLNIFIEQFLPENLCYLPKKKDYYTKGFSGLGDEFMWQSEPFGLHLQGAQKDGTIKDHSGEWDELKNILNYFLNK